MYLFGKYCKILATIDTLSSLHIHLIEIHNFKRETAVIMMLSRRNHRSKLKCLPVFRCVACNIHNHH